MDVFHARLHLARIRQALEAESSGVSALAIIRCPGCHAPYVLEVGRDTTSWRLRDAERAIFARLLTDCPDHPHRFMIEP